jgi:hypothetical protein
MRCLLDALSRDRHCALFCFAVLFALIVPWGLRSASAEQVQIAPSQSQRSQQSQIVKPGDTLSPRGSSQGSFGALPEKGSNTREIPLPVVYRGCWTGTVPWIDSMVRLGPSTQPVAWLTKSYTLCYKQIGYGGRWRLTFAEGGVAERWRVSDERQTIAVQSVSKGSRALLRAYLHFRTPRINALTGSPSGIVDTVDELTHLRCRVLTGNQLMLVRAEVYVQQDGQPFLDITWHTTFRRTDERTE